MYSLLVSTVFATLAFGFPTAPNFKLTGCDVSNRTIPLPSGQTQLVAPTDSKLRFLAVGAGVQNYTCSSAGTYVTAGAVGEVFDVSCVPAAQLNKATDLINDVWQKAPKGLTAQSVIKGLSLVGSPAVLGQHFFVKNPVTGSGISPEWNFASASLKGKSNAFFIGAKTGDIPAPSSPSSNVDWLAITALQGQGDLASHVFRTETRGGQPPSNCTPGSADISVKYASQYWLYGGSF